MGSLIKRTVLLALGAPRQARSLFLVASLAAMGTLTGCEEAPPPEIEPPTIVNSIVIEQPLDTVWGAAVPALANSFFVINNIAKDSGLINLSYSGKSDNMVLTSRNFPICAEDEDDPCVRGTPFLEGRMNVVFVKITDQVTRLTVNVRYQFRLPYVAGQDEADFNTGQTGTFNMQDLRGIRAFASGSLEYSIIQLIRSAVPASAPGPAAPLAPGQPVRRF